MGQHHDLSKMLMVFEEMWGPICVLHLVLVSLLRWGIKIMQHLLTDKDNVTKKKNNKKKKQLE